MKHSTYNKLTAAILVAMAIAIAFWSTWAEKQKGKNDQSYIITPSLNLN